MFVKTPAQLPSNMATPRLPGHFQVKDLPWRQENCTWAHKSQMPLGLARWLSTVTYSMSSTAFKPPRANLPCSLLHFFFLFVFFFFFFRLAGSQQDEFSPSVLSLTPPSLCTALLGRKAQGRNSTKRSCSAAVLPWCCPQGNESVWEQGLISWCMHTGTMLPAKPEQAPA